MKPSSMLARIVAAVDLELYDELCRRAIAHGSSLAGEVRHQLAHVIGRRRRKYKPKARHEASILGLKEGDDECQDDQS